MAGRTDKEKIVMAMHTACKSYINGYGSLEYMNQEWSIEDFTEYEEAIEELSKPTSIEQS